jgi:large subunit ribosomal protein L1
MKNKTKSRKAIEQLLEKGKANYTVQEAVDLFQKLPPRKFIETVEVHANLGIDTRREQVRSATSLPHGTGRQVRVAVFAQGADAEAALAAGADLVGMEDLAEKIEAGQIDFETLIAVPAAMRIVGKLGTILGPKGLMPNPKVGTVTTDVAAAVLKEKAGQVRYRADKAGIVHCALGKITFTAEQILQNLQAVLTDIKKVKPSTAKGVYIKKVTLSTTMGPGVVIDMASLDV